ncbi:MAG: 16S rRNA (guanine(966)-N(2))-methyltransferase RsmD, partial [Bacteroidota bacterium]
MRIIAGQYRNRTIKAPNGLLTRPSTDRVRESLFNLVQHRMDLDEARVLDLFAGTGALGLEAISRGARSSTFVELNGKVLRVARANAESLGVERQCLFVRTNAIRFIERSSGATYDLVLADPPYDLDVLTELPE